MPQTPPHQLDICGEVCPMTFVKVRLLLDTMTKGDEAVVRLDSRDTLDGIRNALHEEGHRIITATIEVAQTSNSNAGVYCLHFAHT